MDILYGRVNFSPLCTKFINTREFDRLRRIKQTGLLYKTYLSANHTRYEHSIGVGHLAGKMFDKLSDNKYSTHYKDLIQIAALYHDIGHFALSHLFDRILKSNNINSVEHGVHEIFNLHEHEDRSVYLLNQVNNRLQLLSGIDVQFISDCIKGVIPEDTPHPFMYQIVCNKICGIDVDKLDYLVRDSLYLCVKDKFLDVDKIITNAQVNKEGNLAFKIEIRDEIEKIFTLRHYLFENYYQSEQTLKFNNMYAAVLSLSGHKLYKHECETDDHYIENLMRKYINYIEAKDVILKKSIPESGNVNEVLFI